MDLDEVEFATPNFISEFRRTEIPVEQRPYNRTAGNDIHGTPCAGVIAAKGIGGSSICS